jgi:hypothetical protein
LEEEELILLEEEEGLEFKSEKNPVQRTASKLMISAQESLSMSIAVALKFSSVRRNPTTCPNTFSDGKERKRILLSDLQPVPLTILIY